MGNNGYFRLYSWCNIRLLNQGRLPFNICPKVHAGDSSASSYLFFLVLSVLHGNCNDKFSIGKTIPYDFSQFLIWYVCVCVFLILDWILQFYYISSGSLCKFIVLTSLSLPLVHLGPELVHFFYFLKQLENMNTLRIHFEGCFVLIFSMFKITVHWIHWTWCLIALSKLCQYTSNCCYSHNCSFELEFFQSGWLYAQYSSKFKHGFLGRIDHSNITKPSQH